MFVFSLSCTIILQLYAYEKITGNGKNRPYNILFMHSLESVSEVLPYSGIFSMVQIFVKIPFPLQKKFSWF